MKKIGLFSALIIPFIILVTTNLGDDVIMTRMAAVAVMMSILWISEAIPLAATALIPLVIFPILGISSTKVVAAHYMNSTVFLLIGGFMIALAMQRWQLHRRIALNVLLLFGGQPLQLMIGFVVATAGLSMWISNTATTLVMLPIALAILGRFESSFSANDVQRFTLGLLLAIAYSASIGGMLTPVGTAPNLVFLRLYEISYQNGVTIGFAEWLMFAVPVGVLMLIVMTIYLGIRFFKGLPVTEDSEPLVRSEKQKLGPIKFEEKVVLAVFCLTACLWISRKGLTIGSYSWPGWQAWIAHGSLLDDGTVAIAMSLLLFVIPARTVGGVKDFILNEQVFRKLPWSVVILFGGGFALAAGFVDSGLSTYLASQLGGLERVGTIKTIALVAMGMTFLTELTSNTATTQLVLPILQSVSEALKISPLWLMLPATLSASCAFMLPVATPPNAIIFGSGKLHVIDMVKVGLVLNLFGILIIVSVLHYLLPLIFGI